MTDWLNNHLSASLHHHSKHRISYDTPQHLLGVCGTSFCLARLAYSFAPYIQAQQFVDFLASQIPTMVETGSLATLLSLACKLVMGVAVAVAFPTIVSHAPMFSLT